MSDTAGNGFVSELRAGYTRLFSGNWVVPVFVAAWVVIVILPLLVMIAHSFFEMKNYQVSYDASFKTWNSLIDSGRWIAAVRTLRVVLMMTVVEFLIAFPLRALARQDVQVEGDQGGSSSPC